MEQVVALQLPKRPNSRRNLSSLRDGANNRAVAEYIPLLDYHSHRSVAHSRDLSRSRSSTSYKANKIDLPIRSPLSAKMEVDKEGSGRPEPFALTRVEVQT